MGIDVISANRLEVIPGILDRVRGVVDKPLARDLADECEELINKRIVYGESRSTTAPDSVGVVYTELYRGTRIFESSGKLAICRVIELVGGTSTDCYGVNYQEPFARQAYHPDSGKVAPVKMVHASDEGLFEWTLELPRDDGEVVGVQQIEVEAGDIVYLHQPTILHRGRNVGEDSRYNFVNYRVGTAL